MNPCTAHLTFWVGLSLSERNIPKVTAGRTKSKNKALQLPPSYNISVIKCFNALIPERSTEYRNGIRGLVVSADHGTISGRAAMRSVQVIRNFVRFGALTVRLLPPSGWPPDLNFVR